MINQAIILAAGQGKRLQPFTESQPKVMLPIANKPILEYIIEAVKKSGIKKIILVVGYKKEVIMEYFKDYTKNIDITYVTQEKQLGTAHALLQAKKHIKGPILVIPGDNIIDQKSIAKLIKEPTKTAILIKEHPHPSKYGVVFTEKDNLKEIIEKPKEKIGKFISTGIYKLQKDIINTIEQQSAEGIHDLTTIIQTIIKQGTIIKTITAEQWMDIVYPWDLIQVNEAMTKNIDITTAGNIERNVTIKGKVSIGKDTTIYSGCYIVGPVKIGDGCEIGPNACIFPSTSIGDNTIIHPFSEIRNSVIMNNVHINSSSSISQSIIAQGNTIGEHFSSVTGPATIEIEKEHKKVNNVGSIIGEDCNIGSNVVVDPGIIIGRRCEISPLKRITKTIPSNTNVM